MNILKHAHRRKKAGVSIEMVLSIILATGVLFLVIGLFNNNLKAMTSHSGFNSLFKKESSTAYETGAEFRKDSAKSYTNSQVNIRIVAEQGLEWYHKNASDSINELAPLGKPLQELTVQQKINLAKALTVYAKSGKADYDAELSAKMEGQNISRYELAKENGINFLFYNDAAGRGYMTQVKIPGEENLRSYNWGRNNPSAIAGVGDSEELRKNNVKQIIKTFDTNTYD